jgi:D-alanine-D-alanine ligase
MSKKTIAVLFGSRSAEHDVSIVTALAAVVKPLELTKKYVVVPIYIAKDGRWFSDPKLKDIKLFTSGKIDDFLDKAKPISVEFGGRFVIAKGGLKPKRTKIDVVFPATHGTYGEDGALMGLLEMANVPYVGCDLQSSVIAMDKILAKLTAKNAGLKTVPDVTFSAEEYGRSEDEIIKKIEKKLKYPAFVKPPHLGSSIGVTKVSNRTELKNAIEVSLHYDTNVLVEMAVPNLREATLPIMGYGREIIPAQLEEPLFHAEDFFDFDTKYMNQGKGGKKMGGAKQGAQGYSRIPADFPKALYEEAEAVAIAGFKAAGCSGIARVDILINEKTKDVYFNEINPLPGSLYAHNWRASGVSSVELVDKLVQFAQKRFDARQNLTTTFDTSFLKQFSND